MVTPNDTTTPVQPAQPAAPRLDGSVSARLWHFRLMRTSFHSRINSAAFASRPSLSSRPSLASRTSLASHLSLASHPACSAYPAHTASARVANACAAPLSSDARHEAAARDSA